MKRCPTMLLACAALAGAVWAAETQAAPDASAEAELRTLRKDLEEMKAQASALRKELSDARESINRTLTPRTMPDRVGPDFQSLQKITLPDNATEEQARQYVMDVLAATAGQDNFSDTDPQVAMYMKVGPQRLALLVEALGMDTTDRHLVPAIQKLTGPEHKQLILEALKTHAALLPVIADKGWGRDAKEVLLEGLKKHHQLWASPWVPAIARLNDLTTYDALKAELIQGHSKEYTYWIIVKLPGMDLKEAIHDAWLVSLERYQSNESETRRMAVFAIEYGHQDALDFLMDWVSSPNFRPRDQWEADRLHAALVARLPVTGTNKEIADWYNKNCTSLRFDAKTKKFVLAEENAPK